MSLYAFFDYICYEYLFNLKFRFKSVFTVSDFPEIHSNGKI